MNCGTLFKHICNVRRRIYVLYVSIYKQLKTVFTDIVYYEIDPRSAMQIHLKFENTRFSLSYFEHQYFPYHSTKVLENFNTLCPLGEKCVAESVTT